MDQGVSGVGRQGKEEEKGSEGANEYYLFGSYRFFSIALKIPEMAGRKLADKSQNAMSSPVFRPTFD